MAVKVTDANFEELVKGDGVVVVDFYAQWCGPCKMVAPIVDSLAEEFKDKAVVGKVDVDENPIIASTYGIRNIPAILIFKDGAIVDKQIGMATKSSLTAKIETALNDEN